MKENKYNHTYIHCMQKNRLGVTVIMQQPIRSIFEGTYAMQFRQKLLAISARWNVKAHAK